LSVPLVSPLQHYFLLAISSWPLFPFGFDPPLFSSVMPPPVPPLARNVPVGPLWNHLLGTSASFCATISYGQCTISPPPPQDKEFLGRVVCPTIPAFFFRTPFSSERIHDLWIPRLFCSYNNSRGPSPDLKIFPHILTSFSSRP